MISASALKPAEPTSGEYGDYSSQDWQLVCQSSLAKMISELTYEEVLAPEAKGEGSYDLILGSGIRYSFKADVMAWGNLWVHGETICRYPECESDVSPLQFTIDAAQECGMRPETIATFLRELSNTLRQDLVLQKRWAELPVSELPELESAWMHIQLEGHPKAVANKGRLGMGTAGSGKILPGRRAGVSAHLVGRPAQPMCCGYGNRWGGMCFPASDPGR